MEMPVDMFGVEIKVGDILVYPVRQSSSLWMTMAVVSELRKNTQTDSFYPIIQKCIDMTRTYWEGDGDYQDKNIPENAVFIKEQEINPRAWPGKTGDPVMYKIWEVKKFEFRNYIFSCVARAMVIDQEKAKNFKSSFLDENQINPYVERANEILTNGAKNEEII